MPLSDALRAAQTEQIGQIFLSRLLDARSEPVDQVWTRGFHVTARLQGALGLAIGVEVGFLDELTGTRLVRILLPQEPTGIEEFVSSLQPLMVDRLNQIRSDGIKTPGYRPRFERSDGAQIAFRSVFLPIVRAWQTPNRVPAFLARVMFAEDIGADEATVVDAFRYLDTATDSLSTVAQWRRGGDLAVSDSDAWLVAELASLYQVQIDTSRTSVRRRLIGVAEQLAAGTEREAQRIIANEIRDKQTQTELVAQLSRRAEQWRAEAVTIVDRFDTALPAAASATAY